MYEDPLEAHIAAEVERGLRQTTATLGALPRARRMEYLRLLVEEQARLRDKSVDERVGYLRVLLQAIDATADADAEATSPAREPIRD
jgi:hypothetical protein